MRLDFDAIVVGGGPAGSLSALALARQGWRVALIERGPRHRAKTCGHCLNPRALPMLELAGVAAPVRREACGMYEYSVLHLPGRAPLRLPLTCHRGRAGLLIARNALDQLLIDEAAAAGATIMQPVHVRAIDLRNRALEFEHEASSGGSGRLRAGLIVGAGGLRCPVAGALSTGRPRVRPGRKYGFSFTIDAPAHSRAAGDPAPGEVHMVVERGVYIGLVQQSDGSVHVGGLVDARSAAAREPFECCRAVAARTPMVQAAGLAAVSRDRVRQFVAAGPMPWRAARVSDAGVVLVGDAAGYVEPFTGEGMTWAIETAELLGEAAREAVPGVWTRAAAAMYQRAWRHRIGARHRRCAFVARLIERPAIVALLAPMLAAAPTIGAVVARRAVPA